MARNQGLWLSLALTCLGCAAGGGKSPSNSSGSVAISSDDALVYAADSDNGVLAVVDAHSLTKLADVPVGKTPERITVAPDDTIYVANRGSRSVSVIHRGTWAEASRLEVGVEPVGLAVSADGKTLYVVNAATLTDTTTGSVMAFDTASLTQKWELPVGEEPRGIALVGGNRAVVTLFKQGDGVLVDLSKPAVIQSGTNLYALANAPPDVSGSGPAETSAGPAPTFRPHGMGEVMTSPTEDRAYAFTTWESEAVLPDGGGSDAGDASDDAYGSGLCGGGAVAAAGIVTFVNQGLTPQVHSLSACDADGLQLPPTILHASANAPDVPLQVPTALAVDVTGEWIFMVSRAGQSVAAISTHGAGTVVAAVGAGANGIALSHDGSRAYVYNAFDHALSVLSASGQGMARVQDDIPLETDPLSADVAAGRKLFFTAVDPRMTSASTGIACGSCHFEGREDGHVWHFAGGPRRTPSLAGRSITATAPFHWDGEFATLTDFMNETVNDRMGGTGVDATMVAQLTAFIDSLEAPDNPYQLATPSAAQTRGAALFLQAGCAACHAGTVFTNNGFANVGTLVTGGDNPDDPASLPQGLNVPSLLSLARAAPYLHDGSAATYLARLQDNQALNLHGQTSALTSDQLSDLVAYLQSL
jgi:YVTN family beta-propeller protein